MSDVRTAEELRESAKRLEEAATESWERSDTDGFLSQWACGLGAQKDRRQADIVEAGGLAEFDALFTLDGEWVPARQIEGTYGRRWMLLGENGRANGVFLTYRPKKRSTLAKHGYVEGRVLRPAHAVIDGSGHGLSGSAWVAVKPTDRETDPPHSIVTADRWETPALDKGA